MKTQTKKIEVTVAETVTLEQTIIVELDPGDSHEAIEAKAREAYLATPVEHRTLKSSAGIDLTYDADAVNEDELTFTLENVEIEHRYADGGKGEQNLYITMTFDSLFALLTNPELAGLDRKKAGECLVEIYDATEYYSPEAIDDFEQRRTLLTEDDDGDGDDAETAGESAPAD